MRKTLIIRKQMFDKTKFYVFLALTSTSICSCCRTLQCYIMLMLHMLSFCDTSCIFNNNSNLQILKCLNTLALWYLKTQEVFGYLNSI